MKGFISHVYSVYKLLVLAVGSGIVVKVIFEEETL